MLACFQMGIYRSFDGLGNLDEYVTLTADVSFGNMGFSGPICSKMPVDWNNDDSVIMSFGCQQTTEITEVLSSGMMLDLGFPGGKQDAVHDCYIDPDNPTLMESFEMSQFRTENFNRILMAECKGKTSCTVEFPFESFARMPKWSQKLNTLLFAQVSCTQTEEMLWQKS